MLAQLSEEAHEPDAAELLLESLTTLEEIGDLRCAAVCEVAIGRLACFDRNYDAALKRLRHAIPILSGLDRSQLALALVELAAVYRKIDRVADADTIATAARALAGTGVMPWSEHERRRFDALIDASPWDDPPTGSVEPFLNGAIEAALTP